MELQIPDQWKKKYEEPSPIAKIGEACLVTPAEPITRFDKNLYDKYKKMVDAAQKYNGVGLAGPQIRFNKRLIIVSHKGIFRSWKAMCNPRIVEQNGEYVTSEEGCLSIPGLIGNVQRMNLISVVYQNLNGKEMVEIISGFEAFIVQHEIQHLDGILFHTIARPNSLYWLS